MVNMENPMHIIANGTSLPLKVYRDNDNMNVYPESIMFNSSIKPTKCLTPFDSIKEDEYGMYNLDFACFGTDEQSIKIVTSVLSCISTMTRIFLTNCTKTIKPLSLNLTLNWIGSALMIKKQAESNL